MKNNLLLVSILFFTGFCHAAEAPFNKDLPVTIEANSAQLDEQTGFSVYSGNVSITQGSLHITANKVTAYHENNGMSKIIADGGPARYEQNGVAEGGRVKATADSIHYLTDQEKIVLLGNAHLEQQGNTVQGQQITYDIKRKTGNAGTQQKGERVKMVFQPKSSNNTTPKPAAP